VNVDVRRSLHPLRIRYAAPLLRYIGDFWSWWSGQLVDLLPENVRDSIARRRQKLFLETDGINLQLSLGTWANNREILQLPLDADAAANNPLPHDVSETILLMPGDKVLTRSLTLPLAAEENLREVLAFEMDQHTPFPASRVNYDFVITRRDPIRQELSVDLVYSPRSEVEAVMEAVSTYDLDIDVITSRSKDGNNLRNVNLLQQDKRRSRRMTVHRLNLVLAALCTVLFIAAIAIPIVQKNRAIVIVDEKVQEAAAAAREGNQLRRDLEMMADATRFLVDKKQSDIMTVQLIDEISRILPDHTWISRLDLSTNELQLQGQSSTPSSLIAIIESSPLFANAGFRSPVVQVPGTDADRFHLSADVVRDQPQ